MPRFYTLLLLTTLWCAGRAGAQTFSIAYQTPDALVVCAADTLTVTVQNNTLTALSAVQVELALPAGLEYVPGTALNANELNISDLNKPLLTIPSQMFPGFSITVKMQLRASCALVDAINNNQLFNIGIKARHATLETTVTTTNFVVETPLLIITQVDNDSVGGTLDDVFYRTIHVRNTRLGAVSHLYFQDAHNEGIDCHVDAALSETETPTLFAATFDGAFFSAFGDGDTLFEYNETITIVEEVRIANCGAPQYFVNSTLTAAWSCDAGGAVCQLDDDFAEVFVKASTKAPVLVFTPTYGLPWSYCGNEKSVMKLKMVNTGVLPAENVLLEFTSQQPNELGLDKNSFRLVQGAAVTPIVPTQSDFSALHPCQQAYSAKVTLVVPLIAPGDSAEVLFDAYYCASARCQQPLPAITVNYFYAKPCPPAAPYSNGTLLLQPGLYDRLTGLVTYDLDECLRSDSTYDFSFILQSARLSRDTGYAWFTLELPWGLFWSSDCQPKLDGAAPAFFSLQTLTAEDSITQVLMAFPLPLSDSTAEVNFCLRATCRDDARYTCAPNTDCPPPDGQGNVAIFVPRCGDCGYTLRSEMAVTKNLGALMLDCAVSVCDQSLLQTECNLQTDSVGPEDACLRHHFSAARTNLGLADANNDRQADGAGLADPALARRDRFMPGDTLEAVIGTRVVCGENIDRLFYQLFVETARSDVPYAGVGDYFDVTMARWALTDPERFQLYDVELTVWDSSAGAVFTCQTAAQTQAGRLVGTVSPVNVYPQPVDDIFTSMSHRINPEFDSLAATGCLPPGFRLAHGDSVEVRVRYRLDFNFAPASVQHFPPLINFELGLNTQADQDCPYNYRRADTLMLQYSGFRDTVGLNIFGIKPCDVSTQIRPFQYAIRLARENFFPHEVRPLSRLSAWSMSLPDQPLTPVSATLKYLRLQEGVSVLQNVPIGFSLSGNAALNLDFSPFYNQPLDEGYSLETAIVFAPECGFNQPDTIVETVIIEYADGLNPPGRDTVGYANPLGFFANLPRDSMTTDDLQLEFPTAAISVDVLLKNTAPVPATHYWLRLESPDGGLIDFAVLKMPTGTPVAATNGIFQLGTLGGYGLQNLRITATNTTCAPQSLRIIYGWNCVPYTDAALEVCGSDTLTVLLIPKAPELELDLVQFPPSIPLCDTSDYLIVELSNAEVGYAYAPYLDFQLPPSIDVVPGSFELAYPAAGPYTPIPDPVFLGNATYAWQLDTLVPAIAAGGLPGVGVNLQNRVRVRFKVKTGCGAVSNGQIIVGTGGKQYCGEPTNTLRKASPPLLIEGFAPSYGVQLAVTGTSAAPGCAQEQELTFTVQVLGTPTAGDSVYISLPAGFSYVGGSYVPGVNAPAGPPTISGQQLQLSLPAGLIPNTILGFSLRVLTPSAPLCTGAGLIVQARQRTAAFCEQTGTDCAIYVATGETMYEFPPVQPVLTVSSTTAALQNGAVTLTATFINPGAVPVTLSQLQWWRDLDGDGQLSPADTLVYDLAVNKTIAPNTLSSVVQSGLPDPGGLCGLLLVAPTAGNCLCAPLVAALPGSQPTVTTLQACAGAPVSVGLTALPGHTYSWSAGAPCSDCSSFQFQAPGPGTYAFTLTDQTAACAEVHHFTVQMLANPQLLSADTSICRGETVVLTTAGGQTWHWSGPGLTNPAAALQTVSPTLTTTYAVTITAANACTAHGSVTVTVRDTSLTQLGTVRTCAGTPVDVFGTLTETPGTYCQLGTNSAGCDSTVCLTLEVVPGTTETITRCPAEAVLVFGEPVSAAGSYCRAFASSLGCDSIHCVVVNDLPEVVPAFTDTTLRVAPGAGIVLPALAGYAAYAWSPAEGLSCTTCANPEATPVDSVAVYTLTVTTAQGCTATATYRVIVLPPCDPESVRMPNAFTPNDDGYNDVFRPVLREGLEVVGRLVIFNRWGQQVSETAGRAAAWDGQIEGAPAPADTYLWILEVACDGGVTRKRGEVSLMR